MAAARPVTLSKIQVMREEVKSYISAAKAKDEKVKKSNPFLKFFNMRDVVFSKAQIDLLEKFLNNILPYQDNEEKAILAELSKAVQASNKLLSDTLWPAHETGSRCLDSGTATKNGYIRHDEIRFTFKDLCEEDIQFGKGTHAHKLVHKWEREFQNSLKDKANNKIELAGVKIVAKK